MEEADHDERPRDAGRFRQDAAGGSGIQVVQESEHHGAIHCPIDEGQGRGVGLHHRVGVATRATLPQHRHRSIYGYPGHAEAIAEDWAEPTGTGG